VNPLKNEFTTIPQWIYKVGDVHAGLVEAMEFQCSIHLVPLTLTTTTLVKLVVANLKHIQTCYLKTARDHKTFPIIGHSTTKKLKSLDSQQGLWPKTLMGSLGMEME
jgi:hypothetical protein